MQSKYGPKALKLVKYKGLLYVVVPLIISSVINSGNVANSEEFLLIN